VGRSCKSTRWRFQLASPRQPPIPASLRWMVQFIHKVRSSGGPPEGDGHSGRADCDRLVVREAVTNWAASYSDRFVTTCRARWWLEECAGVAT
jgi:hypothetical protein